jgi:glucose/arabinose dehydrogenase
VRSGPIALLAAALVGTGVVVAVTQDGDGEANGGGQSTATEPRAPGSRAQRGGGESEAPAESAARGVRLKRIGSFDAPLYVTTPPGDRSRIFVVEQGGRIHVLVNGKRTRSPFLDISSSVTAGGEQGLLSVAFAPDYGRSGRLYVNFTDRNGDTRIQEFRRSGDNPNRANRGSRRNVLFVDQPYPNHNGGLNLFGPDGLLYIGLGDGGAGGDPENRAQNLNSLLGKILRIDPRRSGSKSYRPPQSNPFVGRDGRNEIYAYGLRNPWRFSFDRKTDDLYIGDVGQNDFEEIDYARRGAARGKNYGWSCFEGNATYDSSRNCPNPVKPVLTYPLSGGNCAVSGGVVVRDPALPQLVGRYLYGDTCGAQVRTFRISASRATDDRSVGVRVPNLSSFGEDARARVYLASLDGPVYRLVSR